MKILLPTSELQTISIIPRNMSDYSVNSDIADKGNREGAIEEDNACADAFIGEYQSFDVSIYIREDGSGTEETVDATAIITSLNHIDISFYSTILNKDRLYSFDVYSGDIEVYRGKAYCTDGFDGDKYNMSKDDYKEFPSNDNKYTLI